MKRSVKNAEHYKWGNNCDGWHLLKTDGLSVIQELMPPGTEEQLHCHEVSQQVFYILSGTATFEIDGHIGLVLANESIHIAPRILHKISNKHKELLSFIVVSQPKSHGDRIEILNYSEELKEPVKTLNIEWLGKYFKVEPIDMLQLSNPKEEIIDKGGLIFYARMNNEIIGTASLLKVNNSTYELAKMAVTNSAQGHGIGNILMHHCINVAKTMNLEKLILYSNRSLKPALHLYEKFGFTETEMEAGHYERANIKMEKMLKVSI